MPPALPFQLSERYDVIEEIGRGGHAVVYRAHDRSLSRDVAVKMLREDVSVADIRARFAQEIQVLATLQHAHILHVHDSGSYGNRPFVVMELAPAQTLAHRLDREPQLPIPDAVQIAREVASALAHAHSRAVLHRDVKPENILLGSGGAILADFGIARVTGEMAISRITSTGEAVGTLQYMSPEQLCAEQVDGRSDQYSLACVLYEMLAGVRPHTAASFEGLRALRLTGRHAPVSIYRPSVTPVLEEVLTRAMAVTPADRYRSMDEFLMALDRTRTGDTAIASGSFARVNSGSNTAPTAVAPPTRTARWQLPAIVAVLVLGGAALVYGTRAPRAAEAAESPGALAVSLLPASDALTDSVRGRVARELSAWSGVRVVSADKASLRLTLGATALSDSVQLRLESRGASGGVTVSRMLARSALPTADATIASLTREALAGRAASEVPGLDGIPERSLPALRSYVRGHTLLRAGQLDSAAQAFRDARDTLPKFAQARFWAAQSAAWSTPRAVDRWKSDADEAVRLGTMRGVDSLLAVGLQRMAVMDFPGACAEYRASTQREPTNFAAWYSLGRCTQLDSIVIADGTRRRFRSSPWSVLSAYSQAVATAPTSPLLAALYAPIAAATFARPGQAKSGRVQPNQRVYALPALLNDSLVFRPVDSVPFVQGAAGTVPATWAAATRRGTAMFLHSTGLWTQRFPSSTDAWYQRAAALESAGLFRRQDSASAEAALDKAEQFSPGRAIELDIDVARVRLAIRRGVVDSALQLTRQIIARRRASASGALPERLAALAALAGDRQSLRLSQQQRYQELPAGVREPMRDWYAMAVLGECEGMSEAERRADDAMRGSYAVAELELARERVVLPVLRLAVPCLGVEPLRVFAPASTPLDPVYLALAAGDRARARALLLAVRQRRTGATTAAISWDYLYAESWISAQLGDSALAVSQIVAGLDDLALMSSSTLDDPESAAGLRRSLLLLRDLVSSPEAGKAARAVDRSIARWVRIAATLTSP